MPADILARRDIDALAMMCRAADIERPLFVTLGVLACGGDLPSNVGRFLRELQQSKVLFTADGDLFRASQKRIAGLLLPVPGGAMTTISRPTR